MNYLAVYTTFLRRFLKLKTPVKVVFDCSNGTTGPILKELFKNNKLVRLKFINANPDGAFPVHGPDPIARGAKKQLILEVLRRQADLGVIFDGDGDRVFFIDEKGKALESSDIFLLLARRFRPPYIVDVTAGKEVIRWLSPKLKIIESRTGHYFIRRLMHKRGIKFAGEQSGHYYFRLHSSLGIYYGDSGILTAILVLNEVSLLKTKGGSLNQWVRSLPPVYRIEERNFKIRERGVVEKILTRVERHFRRERQIKISKLNGLTVTGSDFWFNLRASETEPVMRLNLAAKSKVILKRRLGELSAFLP